MSIISNLQNNIENQFEDGEPVEKTFKGCVFICVKILFFVAIRTGLQYFGWKPENYAIDDYI